MERLSSADGRPAVGRMYNDHPIIISVDRSMEKKTARLTILIDPIKKKAFEDLCASQDRTPSQAIRQMVREYLEQHNVEYATKVKNRTPE